MLGMSPEIKQYLVTHGCEIDDDYLIIPHKCQHLSTETSTKSVITDKGVEIVTTEYCTCDIHNKEEYPIVCKRFHGHGRYYIPQGCVYATPEAEAEQKRIVNDGYLGRREIAKPRRKKE
jgi:hypothetical protein